MAQLVFPNSDFAKEVFRVLIVLPLASARELAWVVGKSARQTQHALNDLEGLGWVRQERLGSFVCHGKRASRWRLTHEALEAEGLQGKTWHDEGNVCQLLYFLPMLEQFYRILGEIKSLGGLVDFQWAEGLAMDGVATFERGWIGLYWSGTLETEEEVSGRMNGIITDVGGSINMPIPDWPCHLAWVVADAWQKHLVERAAEDLPWKDRVSVWRVDDGSRSGAMQPNPELGRGGLRQEVRQRDDGNWPFAVRAASSIWSRTNGYANLRMMRLAQNHPGMTVEMGRLDLGEPTGGKAAEKALRDLVKLSILEREKDGKHPRYCPADKAIQALVRLDKATDRDFRGRVLSDSWATREDRRKHHAGAMDLITAFMAGGLPVAGGWRGAVHRGRNAITPDGLVLAHNSFYGSVWHYLEYELSARGLARVTRKLRGYAALRRLDIPLLVVCFDDRAESNFYQAGGDMNVSMLTTTLERLEGHGPLNNWDCWSMYGEPARIA